MTGCLRISKDTDRRAELSIFTGLNNLKVYSILDYRNSHYFGFSQKEVDELLDSYGLIQYKEEVKQWYDGYLFGKSEIYNSWSTLMYIDRKQQSEKLSAVSFWANTSSNDIVYGYIQQGNQEMKNDFERLVQGKSVIKTIIPELTYRDMDRISNIYSFLLFTGYLKIKRQHSMKEYGLVIPNREVKEIYEQTFSQYFEEYTEDRKIRKYKEAKGYGISFYKKQCFITKIDKN